MSNTKEIQNRIKSIGNTRKITRAMEMVAATKMKRAVEAVFKTRRYANLSWDTILNISRMQNGASEIHPFLKENGEVKKIGIILITSNRGLCGGFNSNLLSKVNRRIKRIKENNPDIEVDILAVGKKAYGAQKYYGHNISADFKKPDLLSRFEQITPVAKEAMDKFLKKEYSEVYLAYTDYISASSQVSRVKKLLPFKIDKKDDFLGKTESVFGTQEINEDLKKEEFVKREYTFEPSPFSVLSEMLPRFIEVQIYQALLESNASEHSVRMATMHQATDSAGDMINELTLNYNKERQAAITNEISEISAGVNALSQNN